MTRTALIAFTDVLFAILYVFFLMPHQPSQASEEQAVPPGHLTITAEWPWPGDIDVDLWVMAPGDVAVGYSNKGSKYFNLLRDDLGQAGDVTPLNLEYSFSRGLPAGGDGYTVNVHLFSTHGRDAAVPVHVEVSIMLLGNRYVLLFSEDVLFAFQGEEITVIRFWLDDSGGVVSKSYIPRPIRSARR